MHTDGNRATAFARSGRKSALPTRILNHECNGFVSPHDVQSPHLTHTPICEISHITPEVAKIWPQLTDLLQIYAINKALGALAYMRATKGQISPARVAEFTLTTHNHVQRASLAVVALFLRTHGCCRRFRGCGNLKHRVRQHHRRLLHTRCASRIQSPKVSYKSKPR